MTIVIVSRIEGRHRGGIRHPLGAARYDAGAFTMSQLHDIASDPVLTVVKGKLITHDNIVDLLTEGSELQPKAPEPEAEEAEYELSPEERALAVEQADQTAPEAAERGRGRRRAAKALGG